TRANPPTIGASFSPAAVRILDPTLPSCRGCLSNAECNDGNACTVDVCTLGACKTTPINCSDDNPCTDDTCSGGSCAHAFNSAPCTDGNICTSGDRCSGGSCAGGAATDCNDQDI